MTFIQRRIQPLQARAHDMWLYQGATDPMRVSKEDLSSTEVEKSVRAITNLSGDDDSLGTPPVAPYGEGEELPEVILRSLFHFNYWQSFPVVLAHPIGVSTAGP